MSKKRTIIDFFREGISDALGISPENITDEKIIESIKTIKKIENNKKITYIGIVGSRQRTEKAKIKAILFKERFTHGNIIAVSGGADGIDDDVKWACKKLGIPLLTYFPKLNEYKTKGDDIYFERNELIAIISNYIHAFPLNRSGGTMITVNHFIRLEKKDRLTIYD